MALVRQPEKQFLKDIKNLFLQGRKEDVIHRTSEILKRDDLAPSFRYQVLMQRGEAFNSLKNYDAARHVYAVAEDLCRSHPSILQSIVKTAPEEKEKKERLVVAQSLEAEKKAEPEVKPLTADDLSKLAEAEFNNKKYDDAIDFCQQALSLDPKHEGAIYWHVKSLYSLSRHQDVIVMATRGIELKGSKIGEFYMLRSFSYYATEEKIKAGSDAEKAIENKESNSALYSCLAFKKLHDKDYKGTIAAASSSIDHKLYPTAHAFLYRAQAKFALQDFDGALADALQCTNLKVDDFWDIKNNFKNQASLKKQALNLIADSYKKLKKPKDAFKSEVTAFDFCKTTEPVPLKTICKFFILQQHGKVMATAPAHFGRSAEQLGVELAKKASAPEAQDDNPKKKSLVLTDKKIASVSIGGMFGSLRSELANQDITPDTIFMMRELDELPLGAQDLFDALNVEEERRLRLEMMRGKV